MATLAILLLLAALIWGGLAMSTANPLVISDEYVYLIAGRELDRLPHLLALQSTTADYGNLLFLRLINGLGALGLPDKVGLKLINLGCVLAAAWLFQQIGAANRNKGGWLLLMALALHPLGSYAAYLMPESLYLLVFALLAWCATRGDAADRRNVLAMAALTAGLSLVKQHGLLVFLSLEIALAAWALGARGRERRRLFASAALLGAAYPLAFWSLSWLVGPAQASHAMVGPYYRVLIGQALQPVSILAMASLWLAYAAAILLLFAPSLVFVGWRAFAELGGRVERSREGFAALFLIVLLATTTTVVVFILASQPERIHLRFIGFALPLAPALAWRMGPDGEPPRFRVVAAAVWLAAGALFLARWPGFRPLPVDAPSLFFTYAAGDLGRFGLGAWAKPFTAVLVLAGPAFLIWRRVGWMKVQVGVLIVSGLLSTWNIGQWQSNWSRLFAPDRAVGKAARRLCGPGEEDVVAIAPNDHFTSLYLGLAGLDRLAPLRLVRPAEATAALGPSAARGLPDHHGRAGAEIRAALRRRVDRPLPPAGRGRAMSAACDIFPLKRNGLSGEGRVRMRGLGGGSWPSFPSFS